MTRRRYLYQAVAGAGVFGRPTTIAKAEQAAQMLRAGTWGGSWMGGSYKAPDAEVERVLELPHGGRRYWRWRNGRWSTNDHYDPSPDDLRRWAAT